MVRKGGQINAIQADTHADLQNDNSVFSGQKKVVRKGGQKKGEETRVQIIEAMRKKPEISRRELTALLGLSASAIQKHIEYLKSEGVIIRLGSDRKGLWKVLK